jgi:hypothetical protein
VRFSSRNVEKKEKKKKLKDSAETGLRRCRKEEKSREGIQER